VVGDQHNHMTTTSNKPSCILLPVASSSFSHCLISVSVPLDKGISMYTVYSIVSCVGGGVVITNKTRWQHITTLLSFIYMDIAMSKLWTRR